MENKKEVFKKVIVEFQKAKFNFVPRELQLPVDINKVVTLYGPRRSGKTFLFYQTVQTLSAKNTPIEQVVYINFEDERLLPFIKEDWEVLLDGYFELYPDNLNKRIYLFLDEIQEASMWDKFVRRISEKANFQVFLTGSSSKLFAREIATSLRGRTVSFFLTPFSFKEFLRFRNFAAGERIEYSPLRHKTKKLFQEYIQYGGFPEIFDKAEPLKTQILQGYFDLIFYKDIVERYKIRNFNLMKGLMRYLLSNFALLFSFTNYYRSLKSFGQRIGKDTVFEYLSYLEEANFVKTSSLFDYSLKRQLVNPRKVYSIDSGLVNAISFQFSGNKGRHLENLAFLELLRRGKQVYYFKDGKGNEVDFLLAEKGRPKELIQVAFDISDPEVKKMEVTALTSAARQFNIKEALILTEDQKTEILERKLRIRVLPLWQWLIWS